MGFFKKLLDDATNEIKQQVNSAASELAKNVSNKFNVTGSPSSSLKENNIPSSSYSLNDEDSSKPKEIGKVIQGVLVIDEGIEELGPSDFEAYKSMRILKIIFPSSLKKLKKYTLRGMKDLDELDFSQVFHLREIPEELVSENAQIRSFTIPYGVEEVGYRFCNTKTITTLYVPSTVRHIGMISVHAYRTVDAYIYGPKLAVDFISQNLRILYAMPDDMEWYQSHLKYHLNFSTKVKELSSFDIDFFERQKRGLIKPEMPKEYVATVKEPEPEVKKKTVVKSSGIVFSPRLEALIKSACNDGVISARGKEVIFRRAEKDGEDMDEFEILFYSRMKAEGIEVEEPDPLNELQEVSTDDEDFQPSTSENTGMFSERLEFLIQNAIEDGQLSEQERNAIIKRAQAEGEDIDEVDIYIQSLLQKQREQGMND